MRHLTPAQAAAALRRGKPVEQLLRSEPDDGRPTVKWLSVNPVRDGGFVVTAHHVFDDGIPVVSESTPVDPEEHIGEGVDVGVMQKRKALSRQLASTARSATAG